MFKKLVLGVTAFVLALGMLPAVAVSASPNNNSNPVFDLSVSCEALEVNLSKFSDKRDAKEAEGYVETLWVKNIATFEWSKNKPSGGGWDKVSPEQTRFVTTKPAVSAASNTITVTIDGIRVANESFGDKYKKDWNFDNPAQSYSYSVAVVAWDGKGTETKSGETTPGETTPCVEEEKVSICHRSDSATNPYQLITVNRSAVDGIAGNSGQTPDHYGEHQGPIASSEAVAEALKDKKIEWGDIIPPVGNHQGSNYTVVGQAMLANGCDFAKVATASISVTKDVTCQTGQRLIYGDITNATFSGTANNTTGGPTPYSVIATANADSLFNNESATLVFEGTLAGPLTEGCGEEGSANITFSVACSANGALVTLTNTGDADGEAVVNGETIAVAAGATVTRTFDTTDEGLAIAITIGEEVVYEEVITCDTGDVLGDTPTVLPNTAGTSPLALLAAFVSTASVIGLASIIARKALIRY